MSEHELSLSYSAGLFAAKFAIAIGFLTVVPCLLIFCNSPKKKEKVDLNNKKFKIVKYKDIYDKDVTNVKSICLGKTEPIKKSKKKCWGICGKKYTIDETEHLTPDILNHDLQKKKYLYYTFDNLSIIKDSNIVDSLSDSNDPFANLAVFVNVVLKTCKPDEVEILLRVSSPGGYAYEFQKAYTNLLRLKKRGFDVTILIDDICASGGYMLACAGNKIVASPYSQIGSVGVIAVAHNYHELANKVGVEEVVFKTGKYKHGFPSGSKYTQEDIDLEMECVYETLDEFKEIVLSARHSIDIDKILTAKVWSGNKCFELGLADEISSSDDYLENLSNSGEIYYFVDINTEKKSSLLDIILKSLNFNPSSLIKMAINHLHSNKTKSNFDKVMLRSNSYSIV